MKINIKEKIAKIKLGLLIEYSKHLNFSLLKSDIENTNPFKTSHIFSNLYISINHRREFSNLCREILNTLKMLIFLL